MSLTLSTTTNRPDADEDAELDVLVSFAVTHYSPGCPACYYQNNGDPGWPAEAAEYEFDFLGAEVDGHPGEAPLTEAEITTVKAWFEAHYEDACAQADARHDAAADRADAAYDQWRDDRMMDRAAP